MNGSSWKDGLVFGLFWVVIIACCSGMVSCCQWQEKATNQKRQKELMVAIDENGGEFKVLWTYPVYSNKGHFQGHTVVAEGVKNGKRVTASPNPMLPVPGEVWEMTVRENRCGGMHYDFVKKVK